MFTASYGGKTASQRIDVSIRPASPFRIQVAIGRVSPNAATTGTGLRQMYGAYSTRDASISTLPGVLSQGLSSWLVNYDNYCSEQIVSASMPRLVASKWLAIPIFARAMTPVLGGPTSRAGCAGPADGRSTCCARARIQGGFGVWSATPDSEPFVSAYAMHFLLEARDRGAVVPQDMIDSGNKYLQQLADDDSLDTLEELRQRAYAIYLLTRQGNVTTNDLASCRSGWRTPIPKIWRAISPAAWLAASYKLLKQDNQASNLIDPLQAMLEFNSDDEPYVYDYYDDPLIRDDTVLYLLAKHFPERARQLDARVMENIARPLERSQFNTLSASMTMLALDVYASSNAAPVEKLGIDEIDATGRAIRSRRIQNKLLQAGSYSGAAKALRFVNASNLLAYDVVDQAGYDRGSSAQAIKNGLEIVRDYTDSKGKPLDKINVGEEIDVHVKIRATAGKGIGDVAIVDLLPGGFDPVIAAAAKAPPAPIPTAASRRRRRADGARPARRGSPATPTCAKTAS